MVVPMEEMVWVEDIRMAVEGIAKVMEGMRVVMELTVPEHRLSELQTTPGHHLPPSCIRW